ncbi:MAG TPA: PPOX class F420-dependent oxidoreductase [Acidimicrobiales bacterium]|nr:PPOX class F420-dependent oxidoreductase [Acidimicrobiales bacterium]
MDLEFFEQNHRAILATYRRDGRPQLSPVVCALGNNSRILISTRAATAKARNLRRDPRASICVIDNGFFGRWAQVDGTATVIELPEAMELLRFTYRQVAGEHPDWDEFERDMVSQGRIALAVQPERVATHD